MTDPFNLDFAADLLADLRHSAARDLRDLARMVDPAPMPDVPNAGVLQQLIPQVAYELVAMQNGQLRWDATHDWLALEEMLLHAQVMIGFFWPEQDRCTEPAVCAAYYAPSWQANGEEPPEIVHTTKDAIARTLSRITLERLADPDARGLHASEIVDAVWNGWRQFIAALGESEDAGRFRWYLAERASEWSTALPEGVF